jgi:hypothetical protein
LKKKATSGIILTLLLTSMLGLALTIKPVAAHIWGPYPYSPSPDQVEMVYWAIDGVRNFLNVTVRVLAGEYWATSWTYPWCNTLFSDSYFLGWGGLYTPPDHEIYALCTMTKNIVEYPPTPPYNQTGDFRTWIYYSHTYDLGYLKSGSYTVTFASWVDVKSVSFTVIAPPPINATVNIYPEGRWVSAYVELPEGYNVGDIDASSIRLNNTIEPELYLIPAQIGDYDNDGIPDLVVRFSRYDVEWFISRQGISYGNVTLTITGEFLVRWIPFEATTIIFIYPTIRATVEIVPDTLNLKSEGQWITAYIELPEGYSASDIDADSINLDIDLWHFPRGEPTDIGDHDHDKIPDLMVKFSRDLVKSVIIYKGISYGNFSLTITGELLYSWVSFEGTGIIFVNYPDRTLTYQA